MAGRKRSTLSAGQTTMVGKKFKGYKSDEPVPLRESRTKERQGVKNLKKAYEKGLEIVGMLKPRENDNYTELHSNEKISSFYYGLYEAAYDETDIEAMTLNLEDFRKICDAKNDPVLCLPTYTIRDFISAAINLLGKKRIKIHLPDCGEERNGYEIGTRNRDMLIVDGDVSYIGEYMEDGVIVFNGTIGGDALIGCEMKSGAILVGKEASVAEAVVGQDMEGGLILVEGSVDAVGPGMKRGLIIIRGDCQLIGRWEHGKHMEGGLIYVTGNCESACENMKWGRVVIEGDCKEVGSGMKSGDIEVGGYAGLVGEGMAGGIIRLKGDYGRIGSVKKGCIMHKEKVIVDKG